MLICRDVDVLVHGLDVPAAEPGERPARLFLAAGRSLMAGPVGADAGIDANGVSHAPEAASSQCDWQPRCTGLQESRSIETHRLRRLLSTGRRQSACRQPSVLA